MNDLIKNYWEIRLSDIRKILEKNNFETFVADNIEEAQKIVLDKIIPKIEAKSVSWGGSMTFTASGLYDAFLKKSDIKVIDTYDKSISAEEMLERRRQSLLVDMFLTGTNAITETGKLVNLDMIGNRIGALTFGPKYVIVLVGRNKIVSDIDDAMYRIKNYAAPANVMRLKKKNPCAKTSWCEDCMSSDRICNTWTITEKSFPAGRIKIVLINEDLGL